MSVIVGVFAPYIANLLCDDQMTITIKEKASEEDVNHGCISNAAQWRVASGQFRR
jgi:hypothetical protein